MKKTLLILLLGASAAMAESAPAFTTPEKGSNGINVTLSGGFATTQATENSMLMTNSTIVPRVLYGGQMTVTKDLGTSFEMHPFGLSLIPAQETQFNAGFTFGCYSGQENLFLSIPGEYLSLKTNVKSFPIALNCGVVHRITDNYHFYYGARAGAVVRRTEMSGSATYPENDYDDCSSTKVLPMLGIGGGFRYFVYENLSFDFGYDLLCTFGKDCDPMTSKSGRALNEDLTGESARYYSTLHVGLNYEF